MRWFCLVLILMALPASAQDNGDEWVGPSGEYYEHSEEGWFWYQDPEPEPEHPEEEPTELPPEPEPDIEQPTAEDHPFDVTEPAEPAQEEDSPEPMSTEWIRENLPEFRDRALDNPTEENVEAYMLMQRVAVDRASQFADVAQDVVMANPALDQQNRRPTATFATQQREQQALENRRQVLANLFQRVGLVVIHDESDLARAQIPALERLHSQYGPEIMAISTGMATLDTEAVTTQQTGGAGLIEEFGIRQPPAIFLLEPPDNWIWIGEGGLSLNEIIRRTLRVARREGWITEREYYDTRPAGDDDLIRPDDLPEDADLEDPQQVIDLLHEQQRDHRRGGAL